MACLLCSFSAFGAVVFLLNVIPLLNWGFMFSNVVGAGLMAVDMEKRGTLLKGAAVQVSGYSWPMQCASLSCSASSWACQAR